MNKALKLVLSLFEVKIKTINSDRISNIIKLRQTTIPMRFQDLFHAVSPPSPPKPFIQINDFAFIPPSQRKSLFPLRSRKLGNCPLDFPRALDGL